MPDVDRCRSALALSTGGVFCGLLARAGIELLEDMVGRVGRAVPCSDGGSVERIPRARDAGEEVALDVAVVALGFRVRLTGDLAGVLVGGGAGRGVSDERGVSRISRTGVS